MSDEANQVSITGILTSNNTSYTATFPKNEPVKNGVPCPTCGEELFDSNPNIIYTSHPAQKGVHCDKCNYRGYRILT
jgi:C4-type Zn-finger protein